MSRFEFSLAGIGDDPAIRQRFAEDLMPGSVSVTFRREPSFFASLDLLGDHADVIKCSDRQTGNLIGFGTRYRRQFYFHGNKVTGGYLADLRCEPAYRGLGLLARGYKYLHNLHQRNPYKAYYTVIYDGNLAVEKVLASGRAGLPKYLYRGLIKTPAIHLDFKLPEISVSGMSLRSATESDLPSVIEFLNHENAKKQFAPVYCSKSFDTLKVHGFKISDLILAETNREIVGTVAAFFPNGFRQTHVERYSKKLSCIKPFYNAASWLTPLKPLPGVGKEILYFYLVMPGARNNDPQIMSALIRSLYRRYRKGPWHYFIPGFHEDDALSSCIEPYRSIPAAGRLYEIVYPDGEMANCESQKLVPYIEPYSL